MRDETVTFGHRAEVRADLGGIGLGHGGTGQVHGVGAELVQAGSAGGGGPGHESPLFPIAADHRQPVPDPAVVTTQPWPG